MPFDALLHAAVDFLDLDNRALLSAFTSKLPTNPGLFLRTNPAIKAIVLNYMRGGMPFTANVHNAMMPIAAIDRQCDCSGVLHGSMLAIACYV
jgi:hypothetical protein